VQGARNAGALQGLGGGEFFPDGHEAGHFGFRNADFFTAPGGQIQVGDDVFVGELGGHSVAPSSEAGQTGSRGPGDKELTRTHAAPRAGRVEQVSAVVTTRATALGQELRAWDR